MDKQIDPLAEVFRETPKNSQGGRKSMEFCANVTSVKVDPSNG